MTSGSHTVASVSIVQKAPMPQTAVGMWCPEWQNVVFLDEYHFIMFYSDGYIRIRRYYGEHNLRATSLSRIADKAWCDGLGVPLDTTCDFVSYLFRVI